MKLDVQEQEIADILGKLDPRVEEHVPFKLLLMMVVDAFSMAPQFSALRKIARNTPSQRGECIRLYAESVGTALLHAWDDVHKKGMIEYGVPEELRNLIEK
jgi:hypothetical protein